MPKKETIGLMIIPLIFCVLLGCVSPEAVKTDINGIRADLGSLENLVDQKADNSVVAEQIDEVNNSIEQTTQVAEELSLWRKSVQAETINYGGAGWVVVGTGVMALIFVGGGLLFARAFMRRGRLLKLVTGAVKNAGKNSPELVHTVKGQLEKEVEEGRCTHNCVEELGHFTKKVGTFSEQKPSSEV